MKINRIFYSLFLFRILFTIVILKLNIPIFIKVFLFIILDYLDCNRHTGYLLTNNLKICKTMEYQRVDKIVDTICYFLLLVYLYKTHYFSNSQYLFVF